MSRTGEEWLNSRQKRSMDVLFSSAASVLAVPVGAVAVVAVMIENQHNPVFIQQRVGSPDDELWIPKLRTLAGPVEHEVSQNGHDHPRAIGQLSRLVRQTHLDETPQFGLVLSGKMSVVGPRPIVKSEFENIMDTLSPAEQKQWCEARRACKPGLVNGLSPTQHTPNYENIPELVAATDIEYFQKASLNEDNRIILETARAIVADIFRD